jgi:hypothetical protein
VKCEFDPESLTCPRCGYQARSLPTARICRPPPTPRKKPFALGDSIEAALSAVGITEQRVSSMIGRPCGCRKRRRVLNEVGYAAQRSVRRAIRIAKKLYLGD